MTRRALVLLALALYAAQSTFAMGQERLAVTVPAFEDLASSDGVERIRTQLVARYDLTLSSELSAGVAALDLRPGDSFAAGDPLIGFDCRLFDAQLSKAEATAAGAGQALAVVRRLVALGSSGELELAQAEARAAEAEADGLYLRTMVDKCTVLAPFDGRVTRRHIQQYEYVTPGQPLLDIVDTGALELQLLVPSRWVAWLAPGQTFTIWVDEVGGEFSAHVTRLGAAVDPVSQSITITGSFDEAHTNLLPGMSGWARFDEPAADTGQ